MRRSGADPGRVARQPGHGRRLEPGRDRLAGGHRGDDGADRARLGRQAAAAVPAAPRLEQPGVALERPPGVGGVAVGADPGVAREVARDRIGGEGGKGVGTVSRPPPTLGVGPRLATGSCQKPSVYL